MEKLKNMAESAVQNSKSFVKDNKKTVAAVIGGTLIAAVGIGLGYWSRYKNRVIHYDDTLDGPLEGTETKELPRDSE